MNDLSNSLTQIFCPSCAAQVADHAEHGERLKCPVCGTEFLYEPEKTAESTVADSDSSTQPIRRRSTEEILLDRLKSEPPAKKPITIQSVILIFIAVAGVAFAIYSIASKPDKYAAVTPADTMGMQHRVFMQHVADSLRDEIGKDPANLDLHLQLADAEYDAGKWDDSKKQFEIYLAQKPQDADARVDYSYAIAQANNDLTTALSEIDTALMFQPDHLNALINAGIMTAQTISDTNHATALAKAKYYFERARTVAAKTNPAIAARIDTLIMAIDSTGMKMKMK